MKLPESLYTIENCHQKNSFLKSIIVTNEKDEHDGYPIVNVEPVDSTGHNYLDGTFNQFRYALAMIHEHLTKNNNLSRNHMFHVNITSPINGHDEFTYNTITGEEKDGWQVRQQIKEVIVAHHLQ